MRMLIKPMFCILLAGTLAACESNWDYEDDYAYEDGYERIQPPQMTYAGMEETLCDVPMPEEIPLPVQGPCAPWERGCYIKDKPIRTSFDITTKRCYGRKGCMGYMGTCEVQSPPVPEEKLVRTHCFRHDSWGNCY